MFAVRVIAAGALAALLAVTAAQADVKKFMNICGSSDQGVRLCPSFAIALTPPSGWEEEKQASKQNGVQMLVPRGKSFNNAEALIYVKVSHHADKSQPLADFARVSQERWRSAVPDARITPLPELRRDAGKQAFLVFQYENPSRAQQAHEIVAFGLDNDPEGNEYVLMVVMTGRSKKALEQADKPYKAFLRTH